MKDKCSRNSEPEMTDRALSLAEFVAVSVFVVAASVAVAFAVAVAVVVVAVVVVVLAIATCLGHSNPRPNC